jgi:hypothetical protein
LHVGGNHCVHAVLRKEPGHTLPVRTLRNERRQAALRIETPADAGVSVLRVANENAYWRATRVTPL